MQILVSSLNYKKKHFIFSHFIKILNIHCEFKLFNIAKGYILLKKKLFLDKGGFCFCD